MTAHGSEEVAMEALRVGADQLRRPSNDWPASCRQFSSTLCERPRPAIAVADVSESLVGRESGSSSGNDPDLLPPLLEFLQDEMTQLDRWDSAELMRTTIALDEALRNALLPRQPRGQLRDPAKRTTGSFTSWRDSVPSQPPYRDRRIHLQVTHCPDHSRFVIRDEGVGFDTSRSAVAPSSRTTCFVPSAEGSCS